MSALTSLMKVGWAVLLALFVCLHISALSGAQSITPEHENSILYRGFLEAIRNTVVTRNAAPGDELAEYARQCAQATGISIPSFSCKDGVSVPGQETIANGACKAPNTLNHACDPGSKFQVLNGRTQDAVAVAHCRKVGIPTTNDLFNDIAIIQYNKANGALCFYQALTNLPGTNVPSPSSGSAGKWADGKSHWYTPTETRMVAGGGCVMCHDNGGFIRSNYIAQLKTLPHAIPSTGDGFDNRNSLVRYVGAAFARDRSWSIKTSNASGDSGTNCATCHRMGVNNAAQNGTSMSLGIIATDEQQTSKIPHGPSSPIWMRPGQVTFNAGAKATAEKYRECARGFIASQYTVAPNGCVIEPLGVPWLESTPVNGGTQLIVPEIVDALFDN